eukprot:6656490-Alexandrium_andersonii.AAC.1
MWPLFACIGSALALHDMAYLGHKKHHLQVLLRAMAPEAQEVILRRGWRAGLAAPCLLYTSPSPRD